VFLKLLCHTDSLLKKSGFTIFLIISFLPLIAQKPRPLLRSDTSSALILLNKGIKLTNQNPDSALIYFNQSYQLSQKINYWKGIASYFSEMAYLYGNRKMDKPKGLFYAKKLLSEAQKQKDQLQIAKGLFAHGMIYQTFGQYDSTLKYYELAIPIIRQSSTKNLPVIYNNLANICSELKLTQKGIEYGSKALKLYQNQQDTLGIISASINLSSLFSIDEKYNSHYKNILTKALPLAIKSDNKYYLSIIYNNLSAYFRDKQNADSSKIYIEKAIALSEFLEEKKDIFEMNLSLAYVLVKNKEFRNSLNILNRTLVDSTEIFLSLENKSLIEKIKIEAYSGLKNYEKAFESSKKLNDLSNSINESKNEGLVLEFDKQLKKNEYERIIANKELEINKQRFWVYTILLSVLVLSISVFFWLKYQRKQQEFSLTKASLEAQLNERVRISKELHDELGSSLTSVKLVTDILKSKSEKLIPEVEKISRISTETIDKMNEIIWALNSGNDTVGSLVAYSRKFCKNFLENAEIKLIFETNIADENQKIESIFRRNIYLVIKESVHNVVKHAHANEVRISINTQENLRISIEDNGIGFQNPIYGNGISNIKKRVEECKGILEFTTHKGTKIVVFCPL
jgi:signal transduction histidine kinase